MGVGVCVCVWGGGGGYIWKFTACLSQGRLKFTHGFNSYGSSYCWNLTLLK